MDLLPLRTLGLYDAARYIKESGQVFDYGTILDDQASYEMINQGDTIGVFQLRVRPRGLCSPILMPGIWKTW